MQKKYWREAMHPVWQQFEARSVLT